MDNAANLLRYASTIRALSERFDQCESLPDDLLISASGVYRTFYAPFDHVNKNARLVIVGITPGRAQAIEALRVARRMLLNGDDISATAEAAKVAASFSGPMRRNLVAMLDAIGVAEKLGIHSTLSLWGQHSHLVHFTSVLRYPTFESGKNFSGSRLSKTPFLREQVNSWFVDECRILGGALFVPLGPAAMEGCEIAASSGALRSEQVLAGLPHPSGANAERIAYFLGRKRREALSDRTRPATIDDGKRKAIETVQGWALI